MTAVAAGVVLAATACGQADDPGTTPATSTPSETAPSQATTGPLPTPTGPATPPRPAPTEAGSTPGSTPTEPGRAPGPSTGPTTDAGRTLTSADDGEVVVLRVGEQASLVQSDPLSPDPMASGDAIELVELVNVTGSGQREWELRAVAAGTTTLDVVDGDTTFDLTLQVD